MAGSRLTILGSLALGLWGSAGIASAETVASVFKRVNAAVVTVRTTERGVSAESQGELVTVSGLGSGVLISADGAVLTAAHLVPAADDVRVEFLDGTVVGGRVVAAAPEADVALLQLAGVPPGAVVARLGNSDAVEVGDPVFIVGAPYGIGHTLTVGHVSARHKPNTVFSGMARAEFLQTDAAINRGTLTVGGDVILDVQGIPVTGPSSYDDIQERLGRLHPGAPIVIGVLRDGRRLELSGRLP